MTGNLRALMRERELQFFRIPQDHTAGFLNPVYQHLQFLMHTVQIMPQFSWKLQNAIKRMSEMVKACR